MEKEQEEQCQCCHKTKERSDKEFKDLIHRLNRIEGQIRGIKGMVEKDAYCTDILITRTVRTISRFTWRSGTRCRR